MDKIFPLKDELNTAIDCIGGHFVKALDTHEQDFINAYKIYMMKVQ